MSSSRNSHGLIAWMYGLSGALGLVYEVAFNKYLAYAFGATAYASSAVLVAFMGGLALGAYGASRFDARIQRPLVVYGIAEVLVGLTCIFSPILFAQLTAFYVSAASKGTLSLFALSLLRSGLAVLVVMVPAAGMGATLPLLARFVETDASTHARRRLTKLYAINTVGGAFGSLVSAYVVIPVLGLTWTLRFSGCVSLLIGVFAILLGCRARSEPRIVEEPSADLAASGLSVNVELLPFRDALFLGGASGLLVFGCEVVFVHLLALVIGTSVYAFGLMLAIFLVCLSVGTPLATKLVARFGAGAASMGFTISGIALTLSLLLWDRLPSLFVALGPFVRSWGGRELTRGITAFCVLAAPVVAMGTTFPLVLRSSRSETLGADVGRLTAVNTLGSIAGSLLAGFIVLPRLGSEKSLIAIAIVYFVLAGVAARHLTFGRRIHVGGLVTIGVTLALFLPRWNLARLTSGANVYFDEGVVPKGEVTSIREDIHGGVTTIVRDELGNSTLLTNGKFEGNDSMEIRDNRGFAHLPAVFAKKRQRAMVIGLGTGTSAGTLAAYDFDAIDIVELSPAIVDAAKTTFDGVNHGLLRDPRVRVYLEDGRNVLLLGRGAYDVISIEITSIWFAGAANLYNRQFYEIAKARLAPGGVLQQWLQLHHTNRRTVATVIATMRAVFPHVLLAVSEHQGTLLASDAPLTVSRDKLFDVERVGRVTDVLAGEHVVDYVKGIVLDEKGIDAFLSATRKELKLSDSALVSTDENMLLEYATPKLNIPTADDIPDSLRYLRMYHTRSTIPAHLLP